MPPISAIPSLSKISLLQGPQCGSPYEAISVLPTLECHPTSLSSRYTAHTKHKVVKRLHFSILPSRGPSCSPSSSRDEHALPAWHSSKPGISHHPLICAIHDPESCALKLDPINLDNEKIQSEHQVFAGHSVHWTGPKVVLATPPFDVHTNVLMRNM